MVKASAALIDPTLLQVHINLSNQATVHRLRKWIYFSPFQSSDQKTSLTLVFPFGSMIPKWVSETGNGII
jgi:hypothetical protein